MQTFYFLWLIINSGENTRSTVCNTDCVASSTPFVSNSFTGKRPTAREILFTALQHQARAWNDLWTQSHDRDAAGHLLARSLHNLVWNCDRFHSNRCRLQCHCLVLMAPEMRTSSGGYIELHLFSSTEAPRKCNRPNENRILSEKFSCTQTHHQMLFLGGGGVCGGG